MQGRTFGDASQAGSHRLPAIVVAVAAAALALGSSSSALAVVVVDDDGAGTAANCNAATAASSTIQAGINAAVVGETVQVCPGTYAQAVNVNKTVVPTKLPGEYHETREYVSDDEDSHYEVTYRFNQLA